tara:strand:- start:3360 stop:3632 length:273 start_codon:yes stop_codon:yes gene_type:complete
MKETTFAIIALSLIIVMIPDCSSSGGSSTSSSEGSKKRQAEEIVKSQLNYPSSYSLQGWTVKGNTVTLEYKAKNALGMEKTQRSTIHVDQ